MLRSSLEVVEYLDEQFMWKRVGEHMMVPSPGQKQRGGGRRHGATGGGGGGGGGGCGGGVVRMATMVAMVVVVVVVVVVILYECARKLRSFMSFMLVGQCETVEK